LSWIITEPLLCHFEVGTGYVLCTDAQCTKKRVTRYLATGEYDDTPGERLVVVAPQRLYRNLQAASPYAGVDYWLLREGPVLVQRQGFGLTTDYPVLKELA